MGRPSMEPPSMENPVRAREGRKSRTLMVLGERGEGTEFLGRI